MKTVLLSYSERNKLVKIPEDKGESDLAYLQRKFKELYSVEGTTTRVSFQRYNEEWKTLLEVDEDDAIMNKDTFKVVIVETPIEESVSFLVEIFAVL